MEKSIDFWLLDKSKLLRARFLTAARSKHRLDFEHFKISELLTQGIFTY